MSCLNSRAKVAGHREAQMTIRRAVDSFLPTPEPRPWRTEVQRRLPNWDDISRGSVHHSGSSEGEAELVI
jgi:hypothetical protein